MMQSKYADNAAKLAEKIAVINVQISAKKREQQQEDNKGFSKTGTSKKEKDEEVGLEELENQLKNLEAQRELNKICDTNKEKIIEEKEDENGKNLFEFDSPENALEVAKSIIKAYENLGLKCDVSLSNDGKIVSVEIYDAKKSQEENERPNASIHVTNNVFKLMDSTQQLGR
jgi:hypothetical protein